MLASAVIVAGLFAALVSAPVSAPAATVPGVQAPPNFLTETASAVSLTTENWGKQVSLLDPGTLAWARVSDGGGYGEVLAELPTNGLVVHQWEVQLVVESPQTVAPTSECRGTEEVAPTQLSCDVRLPIASGPNRIRAIFTADGVVIGDVTGSLQGGTLTTVAGFEVLDATHKWSEIPRNQSVALLATTPSALRYTVINTGSLPVKLLGDCDTVVLRSRASADCPLRGIRPAQSIAGDYEQHVRVEEPTGAIDSIVIRAGITAISGAFSLSRNAASAGQPIVLTARGLPTSDAFSVQYRIDERATGIGTSITRSGSIDYGFVLPPSVSSGATRINVEHDGITIASLALRVTAKPVPAQDAAAPPWALLLILLLPLAGLLAFAWLRRRSSREPRLPDPYPDASPATPEPEAGHRS